MNEQSSWMSASLGTTSEDTAAKTTENAEAHSFFQVGKLGMVAFKIFKTGNPAGSLSLFQAGKFDCWILVGCPKNLSNDIFTQTTMSSSYVGSI